MGFGSTNILDTNYKIMNGFIREEKRSDGILLATLIYFFKSLCPLWHLSSMKWNFLPMAVSIPVI
jgi:hypothetical protein